MTAIAPIQAKPIQTTSPATEKTSPKQAETQQKTATVPTQQDIDSFVSTQAVPENEKPFIGHMLKGLSQDLIKRAKELQVPLKDLLNTVIEAEEKVRSQIEEALKSPEKLKDLIEQQVTLTKNKIKQLQDAKLITGEEVSLIEKQISDLSTNPEAVADMVKNLFPRSAIAPAWLKQWVEKLSKQDKPAEPATKLAA